MPDMISLFSGLGGLDAGLEAAGWQCIHASDIDPKAAESLKLNRGARLAGDTGFLNDATIANVDIRSLNGRDILGVAGKRVGDVALLAGGPPCQSWSSAGHQLGFDDPRGRLIGEYLRLAKELDCRHLLFENVRGLITARGADGIPGSALAWLRDRLLRLGWQTKVELFNAADFGVPQRRVRVVLMGYRAGDEPQSPVPSHSKDGANDLPAWVTIDECLASIDPCKAEEVIKPSGKLASELALIAPGSGVKSPGKRETTRPGGHWGYKQGAFIADRTRPARTVTANAQQDWIIDREFGLRRLTPRECAALQSFPPDWVVPGKRADQYRLIGNAVPPLLAKAIGTSLSHDSEVSCEFKKDNLKPSPLPSRLQLAIDYTIREELRNGGSRKEAPKRRRVRSAA